MEHRIRKGRGTGSRLERKQRRKEYKQKVTDLLDKRDVFFQQLKDFEVKNGFVLEQYRNDKQMMVQYENYKKYGPWTKHKKLVKKINRRFK